MRLSSLSLFVCIVVIAVVVVVVIVVDVVIVMSNNHNIHNLGLSCPQLAFLLQSVQSEEIYDLDLMVLEVL